MHELTAVCSGGMVIVGKLDERKLFDPMEAGFLHMPNGQVQIFLKPLIGSPAFITLPKDIIYWQVRDGNIESLYVKATTGIELVQGVGNAINIRQPN